MLAGRKAATTATRASVSGTLPVAPAEYAENRAKDHMVARARRSMCPIESTAADLSRIAKQATAPRQRTRGKAAANQAAGSRPTSNTSTKAPTTTVTASARTRNLDQRAPSSWRCLSRRLEVADGSSGRTGTLAEYLPAHEHVLFLQSRHVRARFVSRSDGAMRHCGQRRRAISTTTSLGRVPSIAPRRNRT